MAAVAVLAATLCGCTRESPTRSDSQVVVAEVDNVPVVLRDLKGEILSMRGYSPSLEARGASRSEVSEALRRLIERSIVLREGSRRGVTLSFASLEEEVMRYRNDFPPGGLEKALVQVGMTPDAWRERLRLTLLYRKSADAIATSLVSVVPQEVEEAFRDEGDPAERPERIRVRQYLFDSASLAVAGREQLLQDAAVAAENGPAAGGVDLGYFSRDDLPAELPPELFRLKDGEVSEPVPLEGTFSVCPVTGREPARARTLESESGRIRAEILERLVEGKP